MGWIKELVNNTFSNIDEMESNSDFSRSQEFLEIFWKNRSELEDAKDSTYGEEKSILETILELFNRKGKDNDMESW